VQRRLPSTNNELEALKKRLAAQSHELRHREALIKEQAARIE
jgi:hypothetical protein